MKKRIICTFLLLFTTLGAVWQADAQQSITKAQATYIFGFTKYIQWKHNPSIINIGVMGNSPVLAELQKLKSINAKKVALIEDIETVNILYIPEDQMRNLPLVADVARRKNIIIITESSLGISQGAGINFTVINDKLKFDISKQAFRDANVVLDKSLLSIANNVQ